MNEALLTCAESKPAGLSIEGVCVEVHWARRLDADAAGVHTHIRDAELNLLLFYLCHNSKVLFLESVSVAWSSMALLTTNLRRLSIHKSGVQILSRQFRSRITWAFSSWQ